MGDLKNQKGMALVLFLAILLMLTLVGVVAIMNSSNNLDVSGNKMNSNKTLYAAEQGLEKAINKIRIHHDTLATIIPPAQLPSGTFPSGGITVTYSTQYDSLTTTGVFVTDPGTMNYQPYQGLRARKIYYVVTSQATSSDNRYRSRVSAKVVANMIYLFSFDAFYEGNLEFSSEQAYANDIHFQHIHSNGNIYLEQPNTATNFLRFRAGVTAGGSIYKTNDTTTFPDASWPPGTQDKTGRVLILASGATYDTLKIDASSSNWVDSSLIRWRGRVEDSHHGIHQTSLRVVRPYGRNPVDWTARATSKPTMSLERDGVCGLKIYSNATGTINYAYQWNGTSWVSCPYPCGTPAAITRDSSYDYREGYPTYFYSVNLRQLNTNLFWPMAGTRVIYITRTLSIADVIPAVRIWNADTLASDLIIASNLPVYIQGNFNTRNPKRAAIIAQAVTAVSNTSPTPFTAWLSTTSYVNRRVVDDTYGTSADSLYTMTINACIVTGNKPTSSSQFSGGVNNLVRLLQNWNDDTLIIQGPQICLWNSSPWAIANYKFPYNATGYYYDDPFFRHLGSDTSLGTLFNINGNAIGTRYPPFPDNGPHVSYIEVMNRTIEEIP